MSQKNIKIFINEIYSKPPKKNYATNKTDVHHIDDIWSLDILDLKDFFFFFFACLVNRLGQPIKSVRKFSTSGSRWILAGSIF